VWIHYPFHPRCGQQVSVMFRRRFAGEDHLVVVQPDGTLALIPSWMAEEAAGSVALTACPRLSLDRLLELRTHLDALLACSRGESAPPAQGGDHASRAQPAERAVRARSRDQQIPVTLKRELVRLIEGLLVEALANGGGKAHVAIAETLEDAHDQDHA
jgi:hypothetical protein